MVDSQQDKKLRQLNMLIEMTALINSTLDSASIRKKAIEAAVKVLGTEAGSLLLTDPETGGLFFEATVGEKCDGIRSIRLDRGTGIAGFVAETGEPFITNDARSDPRFFKGIDETTGFTTRNMICVPVRSRERILGVLQAINKSEGDFEYDDMVVLYALANQVAIAIENAQLHQAAITDSLTGLYHHKHFEVRLIEEIDRSKRYKHPLSLAIIDIDYFKQVNDQYGHLKGDMVIERIAAMLKRHTRLSDVVARYGGEEFAVILPYADYSNALIVGERFRKAVEDSDFDGIRITISVGLAHFKGGDTGLDHKRFIDIADRALYKAKETGRNRVEIT